VEHIKIVIEPDGDREWILLIMVPQRISGEIPNRSCPPGMISNERSEWARHEQISGRFVWSDYPWSMAWR
jgi:hypothetical protein